MTSEVTTDMKDGRIASSMRENLSGLHATDEACAQILRRAYGEKRTKAGVWARTGGEGIARRRPRLRMAAVLALAFVLLAATATAAVTAWREYAMRAQQMEERTGAFTHWTLENKKETVAQLAEAGLLEGDERAERLLSGDVDEEEGHALADAIVAEVLGGRRADDVGVLELTAAVFGGPFEAWSYEDKAWWQSVTDAAGTSGDYFRYTLPREGELTYDEALALAKEAAADELGLSAQELDEMDVTCDFISFAFDEEMRVWRFTFGNGAGTGKSGFLVWLHAGTGEIRRMENW